MTPPRLDHGADEALAMALAEIDRIAAVRLEGLVRPEPEPSPAVEGAELTCAPPAWSAPVDVNGGG